MSTYYTNHQVCYFGKVTIPVTIKAMQDILASNKQTSVKLDVLKIIEVEIINMLYKYVKNFDRLTLNKMLCLYC